MWNEARARWAAARPAAYAITLRRGCFCGQEAVGPAAVEVEGQAVVARTYVETGQAVPARWAPFFPPVEGLFDLIGDAIAADAASLDVTYDPAFGHPTRVTVDYDARVADDELDLVVLSFSPGS